MFVMRRRSFLLSCAAMPLALRADASDPWSAQELMQPAELAEKLKGSHAKLHLICVAFPVLYRQRHIAGAALAGPTSKPEGIADLNAALAKLDKNQMLVLYCGCCPMQKCPNIRPAYSAAKNAGFTNVRVLSLPTNFHTDWVAKGYPTDGV